MLRKQKMKAQLRRSLTGPTKDGTATLLQSATDRPQDARGGGATGASPRGARPAPAGGGAGDPPEPPPPAPSVAAKRRSSPRARAAAKITAKVTTETIEACRMATGPAQMISDSG